MTYSYADMLQETRRKLNFKYFPAYAQFLLDNKIREFSAKQLEVSREIRLPILRFFESFPDEQLIDMGIESNKEMLGFFAENKVGDFIEQSVNRWMANQLPMISRNQVVPEDITLVSLMRRKSLLSFLPFYTSDINTLICVMEEVDMFTSQLDTIFFKILNDMQQGLYKKAQSLAQIGNWNWDLESKKLVWSDEMFHIYELDPQSEVPDNLAAYNHPDDTKLIQEKIQLSRETLQPHDFYYRIILKNGKEKILHAKGEVRSNEDGIPAEMFGTLQDVTVQKKNELELHEKQNFIEKIANVTPSLIAAYNIHTGKYLFVNRSLKTLLGYEPEDVMEKGVSFFVSLIHPDDLGPLMEKNAMELEKANQLRPGIEQEPIIEFLYRLRHQNGEYRWFRTFGTIFTRNKDNQVEELLNISIDVTKEFLLNREIAGKNEELQKINKELDSFTYIASHDLQEPLRKITTFSNLILLKQLLPDEGKEYFNRILSATSRMQLLIQALLKYSRTDATEIAFETTDLNVILREALLSLEMIEENKAVIETVQLPVVKGIPVQLQQLFSNIIGNAIKYHREGTQPLIKISAEIVPSKKIMPSSSSAYFHAISIADNGIGFEQQYAEKIFELFRRLHSSSEYEGTGIGLAICKKIAENHHGLLMATSEPGVGSVFTIFLPANKNIN